MKTDYLKCKMDRHQTIEQQLRWLLLEWRHSYRLLGVLVTAQESVAGITTAPAWQREVWQQFRAGHCPGQAAQVLHLLEERGLTLGDFVQAVGASENFQTMLDLLRRWPSAAELPPASELPAA